MIGLPFHWEQSNSLQGDNHKLEAMAVLIQYFEIKELAPSESKLSPFREYD